MARPASLHLQTVCLESKARAAQVRRGYLVWRGRCTNRTARTQGPASRTVRGAGLSADWWEVAARERDHRDGTAAQGAAPPGALEIARGGISSP